MPTLKAEKKQLLQVMAKQPGRPQTEWSRALGWLNKQGQANAPKTTKLLRLLEADGLVIQIGHRYVIKHTSA